MRLVGEIIRLQVQAASLKVGTAPRRRYDPAAIRVVPALRLDSGGATGLPEWGSEIEDIHHLAHPTSKHRGTNGLSILFTGHYAAMRDRFGPHLTDGIAGENVLVACDELVGEDDLASGLVITTAAGERVALARAIVAAPCVEFSRYALRYPDHDSPDRTVTEAVRFLDDGMRGYYGAYDGPPVVISVGDKVYLPD